MARLGIAIALVVSTAPAHGEPLSRSTAPPPVKIEPVWRSTVQPRLSGPEADLLLSDRWHDVPVGQHLKLSQQITDQLTELGNFIGTQMNTLSDDMLGLKFDGRARRARFRLGTGEGQYLRFKLDSDWHFTQGKARVAAKIELGIGTHQWHLELPDMEMVPASVQGQRGVEVRLPLFERRW